MNEHSLRVLEFDKILGMITSRTTTELGLKRAEAVSPCQDLTLLRYMLEQVKELTGVINLDGSVPIRTIYDIRSPLAAAEKGSCMSIADILKAQTTLSSLRLLGGFFASRREQCPICSRLADWENFDSLIGLIDRSISYDGLVLDSAGEALAKVRNEIKILDGRIKEKIGSFVQSPKYKTYLQEPIVTTRSDRYCIPVKAEYKSSVPGIVHDSSGSGSTLYIEPGIIVDMGNRLRDAQAREREEIQKILYNISGELGEHSSKISLALEAAAELDLIYAKALLAADYRCTEPKLNDRGKINIKEARHILLPKETAVPIDVHLGGKYTCLLITGPNTGGKTVTLKTVGTISIMAMCGMFIPAEENSEVSTFTEIFADIGDEQSIEQSLSTFSGHMKNIVEITEQATGRSLVLLDELGAGTDPVEGAALAQSIITSLLNKKSKIIATSHYGELKQFAFTEERVENASVEFDTSTLRPTYRLLTGVPGSSNALLIASRMGISKDIIDNARNFINKEESASDEIIRKIEQIHNEAAADRIEAASRLKELEEIKSKQEAELEVLKRRQSNLEDKVRKRANKIISKFSDEIELNLALLKETKSEDQDRKEIRKELTKLMDDFKKEANKSHIPEPPKKERPKAENLKPGDPVFVTAIGQNGFVESISGKNAVVSVNSIKMTVKTDKLAAATITPDTYRPRDFVSRSSAAPFRPEINLLGQRADEALLNLDKYLDKALLSNCDKVRIVHGKGTGALRQAVGMFLRNHKAVASFKLGDPEEGGDGVTIAVIK